MNKKQNNIAAQILELMVQAQDLCLPYSVFRADNGGHGVTFTFDTTDCQFNIGKERLKYPINDVMITSNDDQKLVDSILGLFDQVREIDANTKERIEAEQEARRIALAKLSPADKKALNVK